ncbi:MAG: DUF4157 domain-containing protein [Crocosphaera sp.]|nr:DUF4157 domain-containing protein [Crocosphaera sp.]
MRQRLHPEQKFSQNKDHPSKGWLQKKAIHQNSETDDEMDIPGVYKGPGLSRNLEGSTKLPFKDYSHLKPHPSDSIRQRIQQRLSTEPIQPKLTIGESGDKYEQEADRVAAQVVKRINEPASVQPMGQVASPLVAPSIGRVSGDLIASRMETLQRPEAMGRGLIGSNLETSINRVRGGGQPLDIGLRESMGQAMGADFSKVRVHTDAQSDQLNRSIQAKAFTTGQDVFFRQGEYQPGTRGGQELIAHELTHVVQQGGGLVISLQNLTQQSTSNSPSASSEYLEGRLAPTVQFNSASDGKAQETVIQRFKIPEKQLKDPTISSLDDLPKTNIDYTSIKSGPFIVPHKNTALLGGWKKGGEAINTPLTIALDSVNSARGRKYERCHLIAKALGGEGNEENIVPGTEEFNKKIYSEIEEPIIKARKKYRVFHYIVEAKYDGHDGQNLADVEKYLPTGFQFSLREYDHQQGQPSTGWEYWTQGSWEATRFIEQKLPTEVIQQTPGITNSLGTIGMIHDDYVNKLTESLTGSVIEDLASEIVINQLVMVLDSRQVLEALPRKVQGELRKAMTEEMPMMKKSLLAQINSSQESALREELTDPGKRPWEGETESVKRPRAGETEEDQEEMRKWLSDLVSNGR